MASRRGFLKGLLAAPAVAAAGVEIMKAAPAQVPAVIPAVIDVPPPPPVRFMLDPVSTSSAMFFQPGTFAPSHFHVPQSPTYKGPRSQLYNSRKGGSYSE